MRNLVFILGVLAAAGPVAAQDALTEATQQVVAGLPAEGSWSLGLVVRPPDQAVWSARAPQVQQEVLQVLRAQPHVASVVTLDNPETTRGVPDMAVAQDAGQHGLHYLVVVRFVDTGTSTPDLALTLLDARGVEQANATASALPVAPPPRVEPPAEAPAPEELEAPLRGHRTRDRLVGAGLVSTVCAPPAVAALLLAGAVAAMTGSIQASRVGAALAPVSTVLTYLSLALCLPVPCVLCFTPAGPVAAVAWLLARGEGPTVLKLGSLCFDLFLCCTPTPAAPSGGTVEVYTEPGAPEGRERRQERQPGFAPGRQDERHRERPAPSQPRPSHGPAQDGSSASPTPGHHGPATDATPAPPPAKKQDQKKDKKVRKGEREEIPH